MKHIKVVIMDYNEWKINYKNELNEYRENNVKIIYDYQEGYDYYLNSPEWILYGDFNCFVRNGSEELPNEITEKYERLLIENINLFESFINDEINRLHPLFNVDNTLNQIFMFNGFKNLTIDNLTEEQLVIFKNAKDKYKNDNKEMIKKLGGIFND